MGKFSVNSYKARMLNITRDDPSDAVTGISMGEIYEIIAEILAQIPEISPNQLTAALVHELIDIAIGAVMVDYLKLIAELIANQIADDGKIVNLFRNAVARPISNEDSHLESAFDDRFSDN